MKNNPKIIYILIGVFCVLAVIAGIYAQFFVSDADKNNVIMPGFNQEPGEEVHEKTQEEIKTQLSSLFTNEVHVEDYDASNVQKLDETKEIVYSAYDIEEQTENYELHIHLPVMNIKGDVPTSFNNITQTVFANKASEILSNQNANKTIYSVDFTAYVNGDILSLAIRSTLKEGNNPQRVIVQTYNYNLFTAEKVELADMLAQKNIVQSDCQNKIQEVVGKAQEEAQILLQSGYTVYNRDLSNSMYQIANASTYFLGPNGELYIIFAYGNQNFTSEMDVVLYE